MRTLVVDNARTILTLAGEGAPKRGRDLADPGELPNGAIASRDGRIACIGSTSDVRAFVRKGSLVDHLDARGAIVLPGFVDPHTHPVFAGSRVRDFEQRLVGSSTFLAGGQGGLYWMVEQTRAASSGELEDLVVRRLQRMLRAGTTTAEVKTGYGLSIEEELRHLEIIAAASKRVPVRVVPTLLALHFRPQDMRDDPEPYVKSVCEVLIPQVARRGLATSVDAFLEPGVFSAEQVTRVVTTAKTWGMATRIHADQLSDSGGSALAAEHGALSADHVGYVSDRSIRALAASSTVATIIPSTYVFASGERLAPVRRLINEGVAIALSTDFNPGSSPFVAQSLAISLACALYHISVAEALAGVTINAAFATGVGHDAGSLEVGKRADLLLVEAEDYRELAYRVGENLVRTVIVGGEVVTENPTGGPV